MFSFSALALAFVLGGLTLIPILLAVALGVVFYSSPVVHVPSKTGLVSVVPPPEDESEPVRLYRAGWLTVRRTYEPLAGSDGTYVGALVSGYRSLMDSRSRGDGGRKAKVRERFYGVLKLNTLFLYENSEQVDCWAAIDLSHHSVGLYPDVTVDGELFVKRNAICLTGLGSTAQAPLAAHHASEELTHDLSAGNNLPWFIFTQVNSDKEDWLHSLIEASKLGAESTAAQRAQDKALFDPDDMAHLVDGIDQQPDSIPMRWFNALLGRIFLAVYRTDALERYLMSRIVRKLKRVKTPSILSEIKVREVNVGSSAPFFSKPMLKELTAEGEASMEVHVSYEGEMRVTIETVATIALPRLKPYSVRLVLAVCLKQIEGTMLFKIKRPPSNRLWFAFQQMPKIVLDIQPVVSTRQIKWSLVTSPIESRIREVVMESLVVPHMDDLAFFDTRKYSHRGGIWGDALRKEFNLDEETAAPPQPDGEGDNVATMQGAPMEEEDGGGGVPLATSVEAEESAARMRTRRRRSSEGDRTQFAFTPATPSSSTSSKDRAVSSGSTSARTTLTNSASSMYLAWKESRNPEKKRTWFGPKSTSTQPTSDLTPAPGSGASSPGRQRAATLDAASGSSSPVGSPSLAQADQDSAGRLRELLAERAASREREKSRKQETERAVAAAGVENPAGLAELTEPAKAGQERETLAKLPTPSALSLTAPSRSRSTSVGRDTSPATSIESAATVPLLDQDPTAAKQLSASPVTSLANFPLETAPTAPASSSSTTPPSVPARPPVPPRPNGASAANATTTPPPPPPRRATHLSTTSADASTSSSAALLNAWRNKAGDIDKQALAAGVASAREGLKKWSAGWGKKSQQQLDQSEPVPEEESPVIDGGRVLPSSRARQQGEGYREHRSRPPKSNPTTMLSGVSGAGSPSSSAEGAGAGANPFRAYQAQSRMAIPGLKTEQDRLRVAGDHVEAPKPAVETVSAGEQHREQAVTASAAVGLLRPAWLGQKSSMTSAESIQGTEDVGHIVAADEEDKEPPLPSHAEDEGDEPFSAPPPTEQEAAPATAPSDEVAAEGEAALATPLEDKLPVLPQPEGPVDVERDLLRLTPEEAVVPQPTTPGREVDEEGWGFGSEETSGASLADSGLIQIGTK